MPLLAGWMTTLFSGLAAFFGQWLSKKLAFAAAAVGVFSGLTAALYAGLSAALTGLAATLPDWPGMQWAWYMATPDNLPGVVSTVIAADAAVALYRWNVENLKIMAYSA